MFFNCDSHTPSVCHFPTINKSGFSGWKLWMLFWAAQSALLNPLGHESARSSCRRKDASIRIGMLLIKAALIYPISICFNKPAQSPFKRWSETFPQILFNKICDFQTKHLQECIKSRSLHPLSVNNRGNGLIKAVKPLNNSNRKLPYNSKIVCAAIVFGG